MNRIDPLQTPAGNAVFDPRKLEEHMARSESRALAILDIVHRLVEAARTPVEEIRAALNRGQFHQAIHMLHTLNGSVANLGARRVCEVAVRLESLLDREINDSAVNALLDALEVEFEHLLASAQVWLLFQKSRFDLDSQRSAAWKMRLQELTICLQENNLKAFDLFDELKQQLQRQMPPEDFRGFGTALQSLDFDSALRCIQSCDMERGSAAP